MNTSASKKYEELDLLSVSDLIELLKITRRTIDRYCQNDELNFPQKIKVGKNSRFSRKEIEEWLNERRICALYTTEQGKFIFNLENYKVDLTNCFSLNSNLTLEGVENLVSLDEAEKIINKWKKEHNIKGNIELPIVCHNINGEYYTTWTELEYLKNHIEKEALLQNKKELDIDKKAPYSIKLNKKI